MGGGDTLKNKERKGGLNVIRPPPKKGTPLRKIGLKKKVEIEKLEV